MSENYDPDKRVNTVYELDGKPYKPKEYKEAIKAKADEGKPKLSLVPTKIIFAIEKIRSYGNAKYPEGGINNWKTVESERHFEAMLRHAAKCWNNPYAIDPESELPHMFHMACDMAFFIEQNWDDFETAIDVHKFNVEYEEKRMKNEEVSHESTVSRV